jgi:hypothetical protein
MKRAEKSVRASGSLLERISIKCEIWGRRINDRFQRWCQRVHPRRIKLYAILIGTAALTGNATVIVIGFVKHTQPEFGNVSAAEQVKTGFRPGGPEASRSVRSKMELKSLIDSLEGDSMGRELLKKMTTEGRVKLDSALLK